MDRIKYILILTLTFIVLILSCDEIVFPINIDCEECYTEKPDSVDLSIYWTQNSEFDTIPIILYKGKIEEELIDTFDLFRNPAYIWVKAEEEYSIKAIYETSDRTVIVVDGTKQKIKRVSDYCDYDCWVIVNEELKVELRY